ncbi:6873_t:CDS:2, partial [Acaulospora morrowiae]
RSVSGVLILSSFTLKSPRPADVNERIKEQLILGVILKTSSSSSMTELGICERKGDGLANSVWTNQPAMRMMSQEFEENVQ